MHEVVIHCTFLFLFYRHSSRFEAILNAQIILLSFVPSKIHEGGEFLGAVDSAVPCAQLVHIARVLQTNLTEQRLRVGT